MNMIFHYLLLSIKPEKNELCTVEQRLTTALDIQKAPREAVSKAYNVFQKARIQRSGTGFIGAPILTP